jgi:hypothetical protein
MRRLNGNLGHEAKQESQASLGLGECACKRRHKVCQYDRQLCIAPSKMLPLRVVDHGFFYESGARLFAAESRNHENGKSVASVLRSIHTGEYESRAPVNHHAYEKLTGTQLRMHGGKKTILHTTMWDAS